VGRAVNHLLAAGMVLRYQSRSGSTYYLGWPGRIGVLRVSDHTSQSKNEANGAPIWARLTLHPRSMPQETGSKRSVAIALGTYLWHGYDE